MKLERVRRYRRRLNLTAGILKENPVLAMGMALPFTVVASTTLQRGVFMSVIMALSIAVAVIVSCICGKRVQSLWSVALSCAVTIVILTLVLLLHGSYPLLRKELGVYVPLAATNSISIYLLNPHHQKPMRFAAWEAFCMWLGFAIVMCVLSAIREVMSLHTIWDVPITTSMVAISGAALPCFGFILLGFFAALGKKADRLRIRMLLHADNADAKRKGDAT